MKKKLLSIVFIVALLLGVGGRVSAAAPDGAGPWADSAVVSQGLTKGGSAVPAIRSDPQSAVGVAENDTTDGNFFSLGFGGSITLGFDNPISSGIIVVEATNPGYPDETATIELSSDGSTWVSAGTIVQDSDGEEIAIPEGVSCARYVRITDTSNPDNFTDDSADGYDVDGVEAQGTACTPPPDVCPNLDGVQTVLPEGYTTNNDGQCVPVPCDGEFCETIDACPNLEGVQESLPPGYHYETIPDVDAQQCIPDPTPTPTPGSPGGGSSTGDGLSDGRSDGGSSCPSCTAPSGNVLGASTGGQVLGASTDTLAATGSANQLINIFSAFVAGLVVFLLGRAFARTHETS